MLIKCSECGKEISDKAKVCPNCGVDVQQCVQDQKCEKNKQIENRINIYKKEIQMPQKPIKEFSDHEYSLIFAGIFLAMLSFGMLVFFLYHSANDIYMMKKMGFSMLILVGMGLLGISFIKSAFNSRYERYKNSLLDNNEALSDFEAFKDKKASQIVILEEVIDRLEAKNVQIQPNIPKCPICGSANINKISNISKAGSVALWGVFAVGKVSKQWHCNQCKSDF